MTARYYAKLTLASVLTVVCFAMAVYTKVAA
jgi:hypothetical protein